MSEIKVNVKGQPTTVEVRKGWNTIAPVTTTARWQTGCGSIPFDNFEVRDANGRLLDPEYPLALLNGRTLYVHLFPGVGA